MVGTETLEQEISPLAERHGLSVYDVEVVSFGRPTLRLYMDKPGPDARGVTVGELETFTRVLIPYLNLKGIFPREGQVEVSSPGLFRRLKRPDHFRAAIGQLIEVTARLETGKRTVTAKLLDVTADGISLEQADLPFVSFSNILRAQLQPDIRL